MGREVRTAGPLRHRVAIQRPLQVRDAYGQPVLSWLDVATVWASVENVGGSESWNARQVQADATLGVTTRHGSNLAGYGTSWRLVFKGRVLEVVDVSLRSEITNGWIDWQCKEAPDSSANDYGIASPTGELIGTPNGDVIQVPR